MSKIAWRQIVLIISIFLNVVLAYSLIWGNQGIMSYKSLKAVCISLEDRIQQLQESNIFLEKEIVLLQTDMNYIEKMIRKRMNFVRDNEILYVFPDSTTAVSSGVPAK